MRRGWTELSCLWITVPFKLPYFNKLISIISCDLWQLGIWSRISLATCKSNHSHLVVINNHSKYVQVSLSVQLVFMNTSPSAHHVGSVINTDKFGWVNCEEFLYTRRISKQSPIPTTDEAEAQRLLGRLMMINVLAFGYACYDVCF